MIDGIDPIHNWGLFMGHAQIFDRPESWLHFFTAFFRDSKKCMCESTAAAFSFFASLRWTDRTAV